MEYKYIESIYYYGIIIAFFVLIFDYIYFNLKLGCPIKSIIKSIIQFENIIFFIGLSLGSWIILIMFIFNDKFKN